MQERRKMRQERIARRIDDGRVEPNPQEQALGFHGVFSAQSTEELEKAYDGWAETYDSTIASELAGSGENVPPKELLAVVLKAFPLKEASSEDSPNKEIKRVLDCGAGTGAIGPLLTKHFRDGLTDLVAFDISKGMLEQAKRRGVYTALVQGRCPDLVGAAEAIQQSQCTGTSTCEHIPATEQKFDLVVAAGVFTPNHAPPETLPKLVELTRSGGLIAFSVRSYFYQDPSSGFADQQQALVDVEAWKLLVDEERPYLPKEGVVARYFVYEVL